MDVSADGGKTWSPAKLSKHPHSRPSRAWAWTLYEATLPLPEGFKGQLQLACKATDQSYNTQPEDVSSIWNIRGLVNNAWHKVCAWLAAPVEQALAVPTQCAASGSGLHHYQIYASCALPAGQYIGRVLWRLGWASSCALAGGGLLHIAGAFIN